MKFKILTTALLLIGGLTLFLSSCDEEEPKPAELDSISIKNRPTKINYYAGDVLDLSGLSVTLKMDDGKTEEVAFLEFESKGITCTPEDGTELTSAITEVVISNAVSGINVSQVISVLEVEVMSVSIKTEPSKVEYFLEENLDLAGLVLTLNMNNGDIEDVPFSEFENKGIICYPNNGTKLRASDKEVDIKHETSNIFVHQPLAYVFSDIDNNIYSLVKIGSQIWMAENLKATHYADGSEISLVENGTSWSMLSHDDKAYCYYDNSSANAEMYGALYTWAAAVNGTTGSDANPSNVQGVCPDGWHLPSKAEWEALEIQVSMLGHSGEEGKALKSTSGWYQDMNGTDDFGFTGLPAGQRDQGGMSYQLSVRAYFWTASGGSGSSSYKSLRTHLNRIDGSSMNNQVGFSVRCVMD
jgi:uncharacterized protein (TIGR02145 family)